MTFYFDKSKCDIRDSTSGRVLIVSTTEPVYMEEMKAKKLIHSQWDDEFGIPDEPFFSDAPKDYTL